jgi:hypothetical protein
MFGTRLDQRGNVDIYAWNKRNIDYYNETVHIFDILNGINHEVMPHFHQQLYNLHLETSVPVVGKGNIFNWAVGTYKRAFIFNDNKFNIRL